MIATCDDCGRPGRLHRHHEHRDPDVILLLCPPCHTALHGARGAPRRSLFEATYGLTVGESRAVRAMAAVRNTDESNLIRSSTIAEIVAEFERLRGVTGEAA